MSKSISLASALEKARIDGQVAFLAMADITVVDPVTLLPVQTLYYVRNNEPVTFKGNTYIPIDLDLTMTQEAKAAARVQLKITDFTGSLEAYLQQYAGAVGSTVQIRVVNSSTLAEETSEIFQVTSAQCADWTATFSLGADSDIAKTFPRRRQTRDYCQWRFGDPNTCRYAGAATTCDLTLLGPNGCKSKGNSINFGGFPGINTNNFRYG